MKALGYPLTPEGDAAYEAARHAPPTVAAPPAEIAAIRALGIPETPEGLALYTELRTKTPTTVTAPPVAIGEMRALGIPETPEGFAYYNELKTKTPVAAAPTPTQEERNARVIALGAGPEGSVEFNNALRAEILRMTAKPMPVTAPEPTTPEIKNAMALALGAGPVGSLAYNEKLQKELARLTTKAEPVTALPTSVSEYNFAVQQGYKGSLFDFKRDLAKAGQAPGTTVNMVSERAEQGARGKMLVDQYSDIAKAAGLAARTLPSIEANLSALNKGFDTGFGKETIAAGASVLASLGVPEAAKFATDTQKFQSNAISAVLQKQLEQKGPQTESDARRIEQIGAQLGKTKQANEFILSMAGELLRRDIDQRNFYDRWYKSSKTYDGAESAWFSGEGGKSLFDRPGLKKYAAPQSAPTPGKPAAASGHPADIQAIIEAQKRR
jgi:hypothetical protein